MSSTEPDGAAQSGAAEPAADRRLAIVLAGYAAVPPPGIDKHAFAAAGLADTYEVLADLQGVVAGIAGDASVAELLWPGSLLLPDATTVDEVLGSALPADAVVLVPADAPDLPGLVVAKVFQALHRASAAVAAERSGGGCVALGVRLPRPEWWPPCLDLNHDPYATLVAAAPRRGQVVRTPDWHRLRTPAATDRLDPGLEGWEQTRLLLSARVGGR